MHLLLIENSDLHVRLIQVLLTKELAAPFFLDHTSSIAGARQRLARRKPDVIILDLELEESSGLDTFYSVQAFTDDVPIVLLSNNGDPTVALAAIQFGAQDFLVKGRTDSMHLVRSLLFAIARAVRTRQQRERLQASTVAMAEMP